MSRKGPINICMIDHVVIRVRNLSRMIDFYCDALGCRLERGPGANPSRSYEPASLSPTKFVAHIYLKLQ
jgi:catechol 2,3-dioxygenase-like lactoylglutathione lyase family enzyme